MRTKTKKGKTLGEVFAEEAKSPKGLMEEVKVISPKAIYDNAVVHGFRSKLDTTERDIPELLCLIHSEISEALEAYRNGNRNGDHNIGEELADAVIRIFHFGHIFDYDIPAMIKSKHIRNISRSYKHGNKRC